MAGAEQILLAFFIIKFVIKLDYRSIILMCYIIMALAVSACWYIPPHFSALSGFLSGQFHRNSLVFPPINLC